MIIVILVMVLVIYNRKYVKTRIDEIIKQKTQQTHQTHQTQQKETFSLLNNYFVKAPDIYKMTSIDSGVLATMGVYASGTFYEQFANYFKHKIYPVDIVNTSGSADIIRKITNNDIQLGICQEDLVYQAILKEQPFNPKQETNNLPFQNLRFICSLYYESFILVTHQYSNIYKWQDLRGKRIGFPERDSGSFYNGIKLAKLAGLEPGVDFIYYNALSLNRLANMFLNRDVEAIFLTTNQKNPYLINLANQRRIRFIGTKGISPKLLKSGFPFGFSKYINTSHFYANINSTNFLETYATRALLMTNSEFPKKATYKIAKEMFQHSEELQNILTQYLYHQKLNNYIPDAFDPQEMFYVNQILDIHSGAKEYYREIGLITNNPNPQCVKYASKRVCPLPSNNIN